jgi:2-iminobutanoate/2-iminopropanoate deaminase
MRSSVVIFAVTSILGVAMAGCGGMPSVSSKIPNWPQSSGKSAEETRETREAEMARYRTSPEQNRPTALASAIAGAPKVASASKVSPSGPTARDYSPPAAWTAEPLSPRPPARSTSDTSTSNAPAAEPPSRQVIASAAATSQQTARYGDLFFVSGQLPIDARGQPSTDPRIEEQTRLVLDNIRSVLAANRLTLANIVTVTVHLRDLNDTAAFDKVYATYFKGAMPARSIVEVSRLPNNARIEISAVAGR